MLDMGDQPPVKKKKTLNKKLMGFAGKAANFMYESVAGKEEADPAAQQQE